MLCTNFTEKLIGFKNLMIKKIKTKEIYVYSLKETHIIFLTHSMKCLLFNNFR